MMKKR